MTDKPLICAPSVALSIRQPWAWAVVNGHKGVENRSRRTNYQGPVLIHTGMRPAPDAHYANATIKRILGPDYPYPETLDFGGIVGMAWIVGCVHQSDASLLADRDKPWFSGPYGWILDSARPLPFTPCRGMLGLFRPPEDVIAEIERLDRREEG